MKRNNCYHYFVEVLAGSTCFFDAHGRCDTVRAHLAEQRVASRLQKRQGYAESYVGWNASSNNNFDSV